MSAAQAMEEVSKCESYSLQDKPLIEATQGESKVVGRYCRYWMVRGQPEGQPEVSQREGRDDVDKCRIHKKAKRAAARGDSGRCLFCALMAKRKDALEEERTQKIRRRMRLLKPLENQGT